MNKILIIALISIVLLGSFVTAQTVDRNPFDEILKKFDIIIGQVQEILDDGIKTTVENPVEIDISVSFDEPMDANILNEVLDVNVISEPDRECNWENIRTSQEDAIYLTVMPGEQLVERQLDLELWGIPYDEFQVETASVRVYTSPDELPGHEIRLMLNEEICDTWNSPIDVIYDLDDCPNPPHEGENTLGLWGDGGVTAYIGGNIVEGQMKPANC